MAKAESLWLSTRQNWQRHSRQDGLLPCRSFAGKQPERSLEQKRRKAHRERMCSGNAAQDLIVKVYRPYLCARIRLLCQ